MGTGAQTENGGFSRRRFLQGAGGAMLVAPALWIKPGFASELPAQVHLEFGSEPSRQMVVSWSTSAAVSRPRVKLGTAHGGFGRVIPAETRTYVDGLSGTEVFTHHALIEGLHASSDYTYQVLHDGADLPTSETLFGKFDQQCHYVQEGRLFASCALLRFHHSTQQVTNLGTFSPVRAIS